MRNFTTIYMFVAFAITSCSYKQNQVLLTQKNYTAIPTDTAATQKANINIYRIKPQDILQINNVQTNKSLVDLTAGIASSNSSVTNIAGQPQNYLVEDDGTVALTGLGRVKVAGLTRIEARDYIESLYKKDILKDPLFDLKITNLKVTVMGEVRATGQIALTNDNTTLVDVLAQAGGLTEKADNTTIKIVRAGNPSAKTDVIDLSNVNALNDPKIFVQNNDIVIVAQNKRALRNEKLQDFSTIASPVLLVINTALLILTLARR